MKIASFWPSWQYVAWIMTSKIGAKAPGTLRRHLSLTPVIPMQRQGRLQPIVAELEALALRFKRAAVAGAGRGEIDSPHRCSGRWDQSRLPKPAGSASLAWCRRGRISARVTAVPAGMAVGLLPLRCSRPRPDNDGRNIAATSSRHRAPACRLK